MKRLCFKALFARCLTRQASSSRTAIAQALIALARRRINVLWATLRDYAL